MVDTYPTSISYSQALKIIFSKTGDNLNKTTQYIDIKQCFNRVLAKEVTACIDVPAFDNSAMDGFAIRFSDLPEGQGWLDLQQPQYAGSAESAVLKDNFAIPIMTGAAIPEGADTVVVKENSEVKEGRVYLREIGEKGSYIRTVATDIKKDSIIMDANVRLKAQDIGLISSVGTDKLEVFPKVKVVLFTGGDEVVQVGTTLEYGQVFDSVRPTLSALLSTQNCEIVHAGSLKDDVEQIKAEFDKYAGDNTIIICNGGVSAGDKDYTLKVMKDFGHIDFHKVTVKPGFPLLFGSYGKALFFGLPGNPVSSFTSFCQFVIPALRTLEGEKVSTTGFIRAKMTRGYAKSHYRREFVRARLSYDASCGYEVTVTGNQSSGRLTSVTQANCFIVLNETPVELHAGDEVNVQRMVDLIYPHMV